MRPQLAGVLNGLAVRQLLDPRTKRAISELWRGTASIGGPRLVPSYTYVQKNAHLQLIQQRNLEISSWLNDDLMLGQQAESWLLTVPSVLLARGEGSRVVPFWAVSGLSPKPWSS